MLKLLKFLNNDRPNVGFIENPEYRAVDLSLFRKYVSHGSSCPLKARESGNLSTSVDVDKERIISRPSYCAAPQYHMREISQPRPRLSVGDNSLVLR